VRDCQVSVSMFLLELAALVLAAAPAFAAPPAPPGPADGAADLG
jgi:hypothetical protein